jgi:hypothetical protein
MQEGRITMSTEESDGRAPGEEFDSWRSFWNFQREVARSWRYVRSPEGQRFIVAVAVGSRSRAVDMPTGRRFYRAQVAYHDAFDADAGETFPGPALPERMFPVRDRATEGRVNPKGIPCLYMASDKHTAMAEVRPWIGSLGVRQLIGRCNTCLTLRHMRQRDT